MLPILKGLNVEFIYDASARLTASNVNSVFLFSHDYTLVKPDISSNESPSILHTVTWMQL